MTVGEQPRRFHELLAFYEEEHRNGANRVVHHIAHGMAAAGLVTLAWLPAVGAIMIVGALPLSWLGHLVFERNRPAFFDRSDRGGVSGDWRKSVAVALGGVLWSAACALRIVNAGPLAGGQR